MGKLLKYEFKGNYKSFLGLFAITALLNILIFTRINIWKNAAIIALFSLVAVAAFVVVFVFVVSSFKNEMYEDRGYLTFTLPIGGKKIVASKLISGIIWFTGLGIMVSIFTRILIGFIGPEVVNQINLYVNTKAAFLVGALFGIINLIMLLLMIYFSITITRVALRKKKMSGFLGFIAFIVLNIVIFYIEYRLMRLFPEALSFSTDFLQNTNVNGSLMTINNESMMSISNGSININIAAFIYNIIVYIGLFLSTGYLIDNRIDI